MNKYIDDNLDKLPHDSRIRVEKVIAKYPNNKWWRSEDSVEIAKYQIFENLLTTQM